MQFERYKTDEGPGQAKTRMLGVMDDESIERTVRK
jgi:hypothetical protein